MTVKEVIKALQAYNENLQVITSYHSDFCVVGNISIMEGIDNNGYSSIPYPPKDKTTAADFVLIG